MAETKIEIKFKSTNTVSIGELKDFQGNLKTLSPDSELKLRTSLIKYGFRIPIFIWNKNILDGHQRIYVLKQLIKEGYSVGPLPVVEITAKDEKEAREVVLLINSRYGKISWSGFESFLKESDINIESVISAIDIDDNMDLSFLTDPGDNVSLPKKEQDLKAIKKVHILLSMPIDKFIEIQDILKNLKEREYVEYEQSQN